MSFLLKPQGLCDVTNVDVRLRGRRLLVFWDRRPS